MILRTVRRENIYLAIKETHECNKISICMLCDIIGMPRSSYYKWLNRVPTERSLENHELMKEIVNLYNEVDGIYGYRRITDNINKRLSKRYNYKRTLRLMRLLKLQSGIRRKKKKYTKSKPQHVSENILNREFNAEAPNFKWLTDVTEFKYGHEKKAYLSAIFDLYDNSIVAYVLGHRNDNTLVFDTLDNALKANPSAQALIHSDRGYQYTSNGFKRKIAAAKMTQSMSRVGRCIDNGPMEGFFGIIKCEKYYLNKYNTFEELKKAIDDYMYFYNNKRIQKKLNSQSPMEYRTLAA